VWQSGYEGLKASPNPLLRAKAAYFADQVRRVYPLFLAGRLLAPNARIRRWTAAFERRAHRTLGGPSLLDRGLSLAAVGAALLTRLTLRFDFLQHPRLPASRFRWEEPSLGTRLWGEGAAELTLRWTPPAGGWAWMGFEGSLDRVTAAAAIERLRARLDEGRQTMVLNLERLKYADEEALAQLSAAVELYRERLRLVLPLDGPLAARLAVLA
ncbi:MAG: hypothetical protein HYV15_03420, partial [Elusimicrobia bacterium]|nr:hypothetical protein [Elusimicrobiota bacterium]